MASNLIAMASNLLALCPPDPFILEVDHLEKQQHKSNKSANQKALAKQRATTKAKAKKAQAKQREESNK